MSDKINLRPEDIHQAFDVQGLRETYPPLLSPAQVGEMLGYQRATIYEWIARGRLNCACRKRGKHVRCWRDKVLDRYFNGPNWEDGN